MGGRSPWLRGGRGAIDVPLLQLIGEGDGKAEVGKF